MYHCILGTSMPSLTARSRWHVTTNNNLHVQANYINELAVSVSPFFEPAMPMTLGGLFVTLGGFRYDIG
jgi:hypothetical protein